MDKQKQIEEIVKFHCNELYTNGICKEDNKPCVINNGNYCSVIENAKILLDKLIPENAVVITREEYDELVNLQQTHSEELTNAIQSYEEDKADLKINYDNHIKNLEKIIDRQSKDLNSQANRLIDLKAKLENSRKETAEKFAEKTNQAINAYRKKVVKDEYVVDARRLIFEVNEICKEITDNGVQNGN